MRYYRLVITDDAGTELANYSSLTPQGTHNPAALMIEVDIQRYGLSTPKGNSYVRLHGISITELRQATQNYANKNIAIYLGMSAGLPLADASQSGLAIKGRIQQPFGNWQGLAQSMDFIITAGAGTNATPVPITLQWSAGKKLSTSLFFSLQRAFPDYKITVNISDSLVKSTDTFGMYASLSQLAQQLKFETRSIVGDPNYSGVDIAIHDNEIVAWDKESTSPTATALQLKFTDLIGQPTWIEAAKVQVKLVMRADIKVGDYVKMPVGSLSVTTAASYAQYRNQSAFTGNMMVTDVRFVGNSRQGDGDSWVTIIETVPV